MVEIKEGLHLCASLPVTFLLSFKVIFHLEHRFNKNMRTKIGPNDVVTVKGKYLVKKNGKRFIMKGIAFPVPINPNEYNEQGWIAVLHQFHDLGLKYNTIRLYRTDPNIDYSGFFNEAANLGIYVIVPLTGAEGSGVLDRNKVAPNCYNPWLFGYGVDSLENFMRFPNILAGVIGNEVINTLEAWHSAPCLKAYGRDLKNYMADQNYDRTPLPLVYAAQNAAFNAAVSVNHGLRVTHEYLTCTREGSAIDNIGAIDLFGVNVESWCSSKDTFDETEKGTEGTYHSLWNDTHNATLPLIMTEMGCSHIDYNKDNGLSKNGTRDWIQVPVVLGKMSDTWSGFCAYAYNGNPQFDMFDKGTWDGINPNAPNMDFYNFKFQLDEAEHLPNSKVVIQPLQVAPRRSCDIVEKELRDIYRVDIRSSEAIFEYQRVKSSNDVVSNLQQKFHLLILACVVVVLGGLTAYIFRRRTKLRKLMQGYRPIENTVENAS